MFQLKEYQQRSLDTLKMYFERCSAIQDADTAYYEVTRDIFGRGLSYNNVKELPGLPYVCIRIPTGGGKTLVACHAVGIAERDLLQADQSLVLWLVPSNAILEQTVNALNNPRHPYRQSLESTVGRINVLRVSDALYVNRTTLDSETTIIVSTIQAFRQEEKEGRKVYEDSGNLMSHFNGLNTENIEKLERLEDGMPIRSLENVLRIRRPIVIVDEAHNARTDLSFAVLARFNPSCIIEFTATPNTSDNPSNVIHTVSAAELKAEAMIKMPIALETRSDWKELLADAVALRKQLEEKCSIERTKTGEYIRPIMLLQAQARSQQRETLTVEVVEQCLLEDHKIPRDEIAIATGELNELDKEKDILSPDSKIRYVITVQALKEGWDCPYAYVLCSVAELRSSTAVEQILGRIMRLPRASWKTLPELNMSYAYSASQSFHDAANALTDALVQNGFNKQEASELIADMPSVEDLPLFGGASDISATVSVKVSEKPNVKCLDADLKGKVTFSDTGEVTFKGIMNDEERERLKGCFTSSEGRAAVEVIYKKSRGMKVPEQGTASERGVEFKIPMLSVQQGDLLETFEDSHFLEMPWSLSECDALLSDAELPEDRPEGQVGQIDITEDGKIRTEYLKELHEQLKILDTAKNWEVHDLVYWLDNKIPHPDISPKETGIFLTSLVRRLLEDRGFAIEELVHDKYRLRKSVMDKIDLHRSNAHKAAFQTLLLPESETPLTVLPDNCFKYDSLQYPYNFVCERSSDFKRHYYPQVGDLKGRGEEFECAQFLDSLDAVEFWVRNLERRPSHSFWLQTSTDKFYPDFVCRLKDGRYLVVEYKGEDRWSNDDSKEKRDIGGLWESRSNGQCLFIMPKGKDFASIKAKIVA